MHEVRPAIPVLQCSIIIIGSNGSASHPVGHPLSQPRVPQSGVTQAGVTQPGVPHPGVMQPGPEVPQRRVVQRGVTQLHNTPQHMAAAFRMSRSKFYTK